MPFDGSVHESLPFAFVFADRHGSLGIRQPDPMRHAFRRVSWAFLVHLDWDLPRLGLNALGQGDLQNPRSCAFVGN